MPSHDGVGLDDDQGRPPPQPHACQEHPKHAVTRADVRSPHATLQGAQLVSQCQILEDDVVMPAPGQGDGAEEPYEQFEHGGILM